jgi:cytochrome P450
MVPVFRRDLGPLTPWRRFVRVRAAVDDVILEAIQERRADPHVADRSDLVSMLILASHEDGSKLDDLELRDQLVTILLAGHETTATSLAWALDLLLHHPAVMDRLRRELESGGEAYLEAVIKESLRLRPVIPEVGRRLRVPMTIGGWDLPAGVIAAASIYLTHQRPDLYPEPRDFRPERFLGTTTDIYSWLPFGGGTRRCLGAAFAMMEMKVVLRCVLTATQLRSTSPRPERATRRAVTLAPGRGARVILDN